MYSRSISPSYARNVHQDNIDLVGRKTSNPPFSSEKFFDVADGNCRRPRHGGADHRDYTRFPKKQSLVLSSLVQNGKKLVAGLPFSKFHPQKLGGNSSTASESGPGRFFRRGYAVSAEANKREIAVSSFRFRDSPLGDRSKFVSAAPSFRTSSLQGLSYVAALHSGVAHVSDKLFGSDEASKIVISSSIASKFSPNNGCCSPSDVFASFSEDSDDPASPSFDPDLLNAFERALQDTDNDCNEVTNDRAVPYDSTSVSSSVDNLKPNLHSDAIDKKSEPRGSSTRRRKISIGTSEGFFGDCQDKRRDFEDARKILEGLLGSSRGRKDSVAHKTNFSSELGNALNTFMSLCPSDGDQKVVLFLTSLRGIRKTYEDCNNVRMLLHSFNVKIDERDVSMHSDFKRELRELLGVSVSLPKLFINGKYIGGVEEIVRLHDDGVLEKLLENLPRVTSFSACEACGDMKFLPCNACSGSRKLITDDKVKRCPYCNENGLVRCRICC